MSIWGILTEKRGLTSSVLTSMKSIKLLGLSHRVADELEKFRNREVDAASKFRILSVFSSVLGSNIHLRPTEASYANKNRERPHVDITCCNFRHICSHCHKTS